MDAITPSSLVPKSHLLTVALEDYYQVGSFNRVIQRGHWYRFESRFELNARRAVQLLDRFEIKATFFVLGWIAERCPAVHYFLKYLDIQRRRDIYFSSLALSLAVLTRPDGFFLIPALLLLCYSRGRMDQLLRKDSLQAMLLALVLIFPVYALIARHTNDLYHQAVMHGTYPGASRPFHPRNFLLYLAWLPQQMTWFALVPAGVGLWASLRSRERRNACPYLAMVVACYAMIVSIAEVVPRHAVYWSPAIAVFAANGIAEISRSLGTSALLTPLASLVIAGTFWGTYLTPRQFIRGYEAAVQYIVANSTRSRF